MTLVYKSQLNERRREPSFCHSDLESLGARAPHDNSQKPNGHRQIYQLVAVAAPAKHSDLHMKFYNFRNLSQLGAGVWESF